MIGVTSGGATRELVFGPVVFQASELAKLAFLLWGADLLARKEKLSQLDDWRFLLIPLLPGAGFLCLLVMLGDDLGTTFILLLIFLALLWVVGTPARLYVGMLGLIGLALLILIVVARYRFQRLTAFFNPQGSPTGPDMQSIQGKWAVGSGGWFGVGLGRQQAEVGLGARRHDRLHLRHHRRGTRAGRDAVRVPALRRAGVRGPADRPAGAGHVRPPRRGGRHRLDRGPGAS